MKKLNILLPILFVFFYSCHETDWASYELRLDLASDLQNSLEREVSTLKNIKHAYEMENGASIINSQPHYNEELGLHLGGFSDDHKDGAEQVMKLMNSSFKSIMFYWDLEVSTSKGLEQAGKPKENLFLKWKDSSTVDEFLLERLKEISELEKEKAELQKEISFLRKDLETIY